MSLSATFCTLSDSACHQHMDYPEGFNDVLTMSETSSVTVDGDELPYLSPRKDMCTFAVSPEDRASHAETAACSLPSTSPSFEAALCLASIAHDQAVIARQAQEYVRQIASNSIQHGIRSVDESGWSNAWRLASSVHRPSASYDSGSNIGLSLAEHKRLFQGYDMNEQDDVSFAILQAGQQYDELQYDELQYDELQYDELQYDESAHQHLLPTKRTPTGRKPLVRHRRRKWTSPRNRQHLHVKAFKVEILNHLDDMEIREFFHWNCQRKGWASGSGTVWHALKETQPRLCATIWVRSSSGRHMRLEFDGQGSWRNRNVRAGSAAVRGMLRGTLVPVQRL